MQTTPTVRAVATREGRWWLVDLPDLGTATQARRFRDVEWMARECAALWLDLPDGVEPHITVEYPVPAAARSKWDTSQQKAAHARSESAEAAALAREVVSSMRADGYSFPELARILGVSPQRVHQLAATGTSSR